MLELRFAGTRSGCGLTFGNYRATRRFTLLAVE